MFCFQFRKRLRKSGRSQVFYKRGVLKVFAKFTGKQLYRNLVSNFIEKKTLAQVFSCEFCKIFMIIIIIVIIIIIIIKI